MRQVPIATPARASAHPERTDETDYGPGDLIASKYRLQHLIGEGGMGTVWLARNMTLHADVALKLVRRQIAGSDEAAQRLLTEARATAQLEHPAIVKVHDFGETERGDPFIVMELLKGESLDDMIEELGLLPPPFVGQVLLPILSALTVAHDKGVVHRDIKPDNILLVPDGADGYLPKLVDFGIARLRYRTVETDDQGETDEEVAERMTRMGRILGSPEFMSPEQARGDLSIDGRSDLWSITIVMYHAITGDFPFDGPDVEAQLLSILADPPTPLAAHGIADDELWSVLHKGLQKPAAMRWQNANRMGRALAAWLLNQGVDADITGRSLRRQWTDMRSSRTPTVSNYPSVPPPAFSSHPGLGSSPAGHSSQPSVSSTPPAVASHPSIPGALGSEPSIPPPGRLPVEGRLSSGAPGPVVGEAAPSGNGVGRAVMGGVLLAAVASAALLFSRDRGSEEPAPATSPPHTAAAATPTVHDRPEPSTSATSRALDVPEPEAPEDAEETDEIEEIEEDTTRPKVGSNRSRARPEATTEASATPTTIPDPVPPAPKPAPSDGAMPLPDDALF